MKSIHHIGDKLAVGLSIACALHCFVFPVLLATLPSLGALTIGNDESFHLWMLVGVLPTSCLTLAMGCREHKRIIFLVIGLTGLFVLSVSAIWGHDLVGCSNEKYLTLLGSSCLTFAHINNYLQCRKVKCSSHARLQQFSRYEKKLSNL